MTQGFQQPDSQSIVSVEPQQVQVDYRVYPNPTKDWLYVRLDAAQPVQLSFQLFDAKGQETMIPLQRVQLTGTETLRFDLASLPYGIYMLRMINTEGVVFEIFSDTEGSLMQALTYLNPMSHNIIYIFIVGLICIVSPITSKAQIFRAESEPVTLQFGYPDLQIEDDLRYTDENGNNLLEPTESAFIRFTLTNKGKYPAQNIVITTEDL